MYPFVLVVHVPMTKIWRRTGQYRSGVVALFMFSVLAPGGQAKNQPD
jgi:hypothetical protein